MSIINIFDLSHKVAIVTGGYGHLGTSISEALAEAGADVYIVGKNKEKCIEIANLIQKSVNSKITGLELDISSTKSIEDCFNQIIEKSSKIDILVNNASYAISEKLEDMTSENWQQGIEGTINGVFRCTKAVLSYMKNNNSGSIINISSMYGIVSPDPSIYLKNNFNNSPSYGSGKAGIIQFSRYCACYLAKNGIRVNTISPGPFPNTDVQKNQDFISELEKKTPMGRIGKPHEIKGAIVFLASNASSYVTGQNISVDGGWTAW